MMYESDLFTSDTVYKFFYFLKEGSLTVQVESELQEKSFCKIKDEKKADFHIEKRDNEIFLKFIGGVEQPLSGLDLNFFHDLCSFRRTLKREEHLNQSSVFFNAFTLDNEDEKQLYWKLLKGCIDIKVNATSSLGNEQIFGQLIKVPDVKRKLDCLFRTFDELTYEPFGHDHIIAYDRFYILATPLEIGCRDSLVILKAIYDFIHSPLFFKDGSLGEMKHVTIENILSFLEFPTVLISETRAVLHHNELFAHLNILPSVLFENKENGWLEYNGKMYKIISQELPDKSLLFILINHLVPVDTSIERQSELGIISGSIAHELINPIAGILAGLSLLELDEWDNENLKMLCDLRESAMRCKGLIDTFLGFSRSRGIGAMFLSLDMVMEQSASLLRHRMIESGISIRLVCNDENSANRVKSTVLPMVFYLIFNEFLTIFSHQLLLNTGIGKSLDLRFNRVGECLVISFDNLNISKKERETINQKLVAHLLEMEGMRLHVNESTIEFEGIYDS